MWSTNFVTNRKLHTYIYIYIYICLYQWLRIHLPMQEKWVRSLGQEDPLEEEMATHSSILAWRIPKDREAWRAAVHGVAKSWIQLSN